MTTYVYRALCEWDCGQEYQVFATETLANEWLSVEAMRGTDIDTTYSGLIEEGLVAVEKLELVTETGEDMTQMTFLPKTPADMVSEYAEVSRQEGTEELYKDLIEEEYRELQYELYSGDSYTAELKEMADLVYVLYGYARVKGYNLDKAVERVHQNNLKRIRQDDGSVSRRADGKIIKNPNTEKVKLDDLV